MPRASRPPSNFTSDNHTLYAGWVLGELAKQKLPLKAVRDDQGNYTNRVTLDAGGASVTLLIPPPPDDWDLFASDGGGGKDGPTFRGQDQPEGDKAEQGDQPAAEQPAEQPSA